MVKYAFYKGNEAIEMSQVADEIDSVCGGLGDNLDPIFECLIQIGLSASASSGKVTKKTLKPVLDRLVDSGAINKSMESLCYRVFRDYCFNLGCEFGVILSPNLTTKEAARC